MSKRVSNFGELDYFNESGRSNAPIYPLDVNELNPESKNRVMNQSNTIDFLCDKWYGEYHEHIAIIDEDGYTRVANKGNAVSCGLTVEQEEAYLEGSTVLHTHTPDRNKANGGTFSWADIKSSGYGEKGQVVSAPEGTYTMTFGPHADVRGFEKRIWRDKQKIERQIASERTEVMKKYKNNEYQNDMAAYRDSNNRQLSVIHEYYKEHAAEYGIEYKFTPNQEAMNNEKSKYYIADKKLKLQSSRKPRRGGKGSLTQPTARFEDRQTRKVYMQYKVGNELRVTDGKRTYRGADAQEIYNKCRRTKSVSKKQFNDWKRRQKRKKAKK